MEFENSPPITPKDRLQADTPRIVLEPVHENVLPVTVPRVTHFNDQAGEGLSFEFEAESTAAAAVSAPKQTKPVSHYVALIGACVVSALFVGGLVALQSLV